MKDDLDLVDDFSKAVEEVKTLRSELFNKQGEIIKLEEIIMRLEQRIRFLETTYLENSGRYMDGR